MAYSQTIGETGGTGAIAFSVSVGSLPVGLSLDPSTGAITGTPTDSADSPYAFTVTATDAVGAAGSQAYSVTINSLSITTLTLPDWTVGVAYDQTIAESGGVAPVAFSVSAGSLPTGLSLDPNSGAITGTPTDSADSPYAFTITATDADGNAGSQAYTVAINPAPSITTLTLPSGTVGQAYSQTIGETGGTGAIAFSVSAGTLPTGLSLDPSTGAITGTPTDSADSPFNFTVTATDAVGAAGSQDYSVTINSVPSITTLTLPDWTVGQAYDQTIAESGGVAPVAFSVSAGSLPTGLSLDPNSGEITGTPTDSADSPYVPADLSRHQVPNDDALGVAVDDHEVEHLRLGVQLDPAGAHPLGKGRVGAEEQLLAGLAPGVEGARDLGAPE